MPIRTLSTTGEQLLPQNRLRRSFIIQNEDSAINVFLKFERPGATDVSSTIHDHRIGPGGSLALNSDTDGLQQIQERVTIIAASGTPIVSFFETEDIRR